MVGRVVGAAQRQFQPGDVGQVGVARKLRDPGEEIRHLLPVMGQLPPLGRVAARVKQRQRAERALAHQLAQHRKTDFERLGQRGGEVVAVDGEALARGATLRVAKPRWHRQRGVEKGGGEILLAHGLRP